MAKKLVSVSGYTLCFLLLSLLLQIPISYSVSVIEFLPGFEGRIPFHLETGYIGVGEEEEVQLFYYFAKSEGNPEKDPLILWLTGGPGCSAASDLFNEIGPLYFKKAEFNGSLPTLLLREYSWTKIASIIFVDSPVNTGFSYATTPAASWSSDTLQVQHLHEFFRKWLIGHPEFLSNAVYMGADSYAGIILPGLVQDILNGNGGMKPVIDVQGYILGNPSTVPHLEDNSRIPFAYGMGLISEELYESLRRSCGGEYKNIDPRNTACLEHMQLYNKCVSGVSSSHILDRKCVVLSPTPQEIYKRRRFLYKDSNDIDLDSPDIRCRSYSFLLLQYWANDDDVRKALQIKKGSIGIWRRCNFDNLNYTKDIKESFDHHVNLSVKGVPALIYSGDHDMIVPSLGTQAWIRNLNYSIVDDWRPWMVEGQVGGYTRSYSNKMTFATVKGGGHTAPEYKPKECFFMFQRWISGENL